MTSGELRLGRVRVVVERGRVRALGDLPPYSIALDGYVAGPALDPDHRRFSFDHHANCVRLATTASCRQVLDALCLGLEPEGYTVFVNDVDGDTALSVALLAHPMWASMASVRRLVDVVADADAHGPAYPSTDPDLGRHFARHAMLPASVAGADPPELAEVLRECVERIEQLVDGSLPSDDLADGDDPGRSYEVVRTGTGWVLATSSRPAFDLVYRDGHHRAVLFQPLPDGSYAYTVARRSDLVDDFPVGPGSRRGTILWELARREPGWGGGSSIGGAPRHGDGGRSRLQPDDVFEIVESVVVADRQTSCPSALTSAS